MPRTGRAKLVADRWCHVVFAFDEQKWKTHAWIDGKFVGSFQCEKYGNGLEVLSLTSDHAGYPVYFDNIRVKEI